VQNTLRVARLQNRQDLVYARESRWERRCTPALRATHRRLTAASSPTIPEVALVALRGRIITVYMRWGHRAGESTEPLR